MVVGTVTCRGRSHYKLCQYKLELRVMEDCLPVIMKLDLPAALLVDRLARSSLNVIADDIQLVGVLSDEVLQNRPDDGLHARGHNDRGDLVFKGPFEILLEAGVEGDVLHEQVDAFVVWSGDRVHHFSEGLTARVLDTLCGVSGVF